MKIPEVGFEILHCHSTVGSPLDGFGDPEEYAEAAISNNQKFLCLTEHGLQASIPRQIRSCQKNNLQPLFGIELYVNDLTDKWNPKELSKEDKKKYSKSYHLLSIAQNQLGLKNLTHLGSWGWINGYYRKPRVTYEQLLKYKEGIIFTSCCYNSEIGQAFDLGGKDLAQDMLEKYMAMFGSNFYLEIMLLDFKKQSAYNVFIVEMSQKYHLPIIVTTDTHFCKKEHSFYQRLMLAIRSSQGKNAKTLKELEEAEANQEDLFELQDKQLFYKSEKDLNEKWISDYQDTIPLEIFQQAKYETTQVAEMCKGIEIDNNPKLPQILDADDKLKEILLRNFKKKGFTGQIEYQKRLKHEYEFICRKGFSSYFLILKDITDENRRKLPELLQFGNGTEAISPGRGSAGGSLLLYILGVTQVDPVKFDLLFERFLNESRSGSEMKVFFTQEPLRS